jgi:hypothetical protein
LALDYDSRSRRKGQPPRPAGAPLAELDVGIDDHWQPERLQSYFATLTKSVRLLAYYYARTTEPEEAVRRAIADLTGNPVHIDESIIKAWIPRKFDAHAVRLVADTMRRDLMGTADDAETPRSGGSTDSRIDVSASGLRMTKEADDIADAWLDKAAKLRRGRTPNENGSIFDFIADVAKGAIGGARDAAQETLEGLDTLAGLIGKDTDFAKRFALPEVGKTKTEGGAFARSVSQFLVGFIPAFKTIKLASGGVALTKVGKFAQMESAAAIASTTVIDPLEERLSNTWQELGLPQNILTDYLAADPNDGEVEGRLKNAIESLALGTMLAGGLALSAKILRAARRAITPQSVAAGSLAEAGLSADNESKTDPAPDGLAEEEDQRDTESGSLLNPYTGGAASAVGFAGSNRSVDPRPLRQAWEEREGKPWPIDKNGRRYDVHHKIALEDGGTNDLSNIEPMEHKEHMRHHKENGDFSRWARERWARRKAAVLGGAKAVGKAAAKLVTRGKLKGE